MYQLVADDAICCPGGVTQLDIHISIDAQQLLLGVSAAIRLFQKGHASLWQFTRIPGNSQIIV